MSSESLIPIEGCWVVRRGPEKAPLGRVLTYRTTTRGIEVQVVWGDADKQWVPVESLGSGFQQGWLVQDVPMSATRTTLGSGAVVGRRRLGGRDQVLVQLERDGRSVWLPFENLRRLKDVRLRYVRAETNIEDHAERFRLKLLANALESWNNLTGALDRLDIDPLPHQIQLVHRILSSGNYNWLIADDVGLGKTIEVGLLLAALKRKGQARRVLVVSPAGLTRQWQDELQFKFGQEYRIYGLDFTVNDPRHWKLYDHVIASIDLLKRDEQLQTVKQAGRWDVVIFDEGHKLTRYADGERAQRYRLAEILRPMSDAFLLLSGTPHQGYVDRFTALLELVRPDLRAQLHTLEANPEIVAELILRNRKSEVTDAEGRFIFKGLKVHRVPIQPSQQSRAFQDLLRDYLRRGYRAGEGAGFAGRAIGFVMTTYRKLASSSVAAIERALRLRRDRLTGRLAAERDAVGQEELSLNDLSEGGDEQDLLAERIGSAPVGEFFTAERDLLDELLQAVETVRANDEKLKIFVEQVVEPLIREGKKLLVFTEYRATQQYLQKILAERFPGAGDVLLINGSMKLSDKLDVIKGFNEGPNQFLVSTEAGGEGLNLQRSCHVMVNYDLPWNPARLVQRIGRLYRYGQELPVVVFNLHAQDSFDNAAIDLMMQRVDQIVRNMAPVGTEFNDRLYAEILGEMLETLDFASVLQAATSMEIERTDEQISEAVSRAQQAKRLQDEIFAHIPGFDATGLAGTLGFTMQHVSIFVRQMLPIIGAALEEETHGGAVWQVRLPEELRGEFPEFAQRTVVRITTDRRMAQRLGDVALLDFESSFFQHLIMFAKSHKFDGIYAAVKAPAGRSGALGAFKLRWQNDQGDPLSEEFVSILSGDDGGIEVNPAILAEMLVAVASPADVPTVDAQRQVRYGALLAAAEARLGADSTRFKHPNGIIPIAAADLS